MEEKYQVYLLGEFLLDVGQRKLKHQGESIHLTTLPFHVLVYLIEHHDRLVTREELLDRFWEGKDVYDDTLRKAVGAIRKALDDRQEQPRFIETRYGEGYRYIGPLAEGAASGIEERDQDEAGGSSIPITPASSPPAAVPSPSSRARLAAIFGLAVGLVILFAVVSAFYRENIRKVEKAAVPIRSLAVLPLKNLSGDATREYFSDGVAEILINELGKIPGLKIISRSSVFSLKDKDLDPREIGRRLGVEAILEGGVRQEAGTVRVMVRLVSTADGRVLWTGDSQTRALGESAVVQDEIGCSVAASLKTTLCGAPSHKPGTNNPAAYDAYLQASAARRKGDVHGAAKLFAQATAADPNYALAWAGLTEAYALMEVNSLAPPRSAAPKAKEYAARAMALDPSLAAPHAALGLLATLSERRWAEGDGHFRQALALNPNHAIAHAWYASSLLAQARFAEAESELLRAQELDPLNLSIKNSLAEAYYYWRRPDRCLEQTDKMAALAPDSEIPYLYQSRCYLQQGRHDDAWRIALKSSDPILRTWVLAVKGPPEEARRAIEEFAQSQSGANSPYAVGELYAMLGDRERAFAWLHRAADRQQADLVSLKIDPSLDNLRADPRYVELLRRVGLPE